MSATDGADDGAHPAEDALGSILLKEKFGDLCNAFAKEAKKLDEDLLSLLQTANYKKKGGALDTVARISHLNASACDAVDAARAHQNAYHQLENKSDSRSTAVRTVREAINTLHACHEDLTAVLAKTEHLANSVHLTKKRKVNLVDAMYLAKRLRYTVNATKTGDVHFKIPRPEVFHMKSGSLMFRSMG